MVLLFTSEAETRLKTCRLFSALSHQSAFVVLCNYCQQLQKPGAGFEGFTKIMTLFDV